MGTHLSVYNVSFQATYRVYGLDFGNTYKRLEAELKTRGTIEKLADIVKGNFDFYILVNEEPVWIQISNKGAVNVFNGNEDCIKKAVELLKPLTVDTSGKPCISWLLDNYQKIGSEKIASRIAEPASQLSTRVENTIEKLRYELLREPTIVEIAREIGETPEETHKIVWKTTPITKWQAPSGDSTFWKLHEIYEIAALLEHFDEEAVRNRALGIPESWQDGHGTIINQGLRSFSPYSIDFVISRARYALENERDKLPTIIFINDDGFDGDQQIEFILSWPEGSCFGDSTEFYDKTTNRLSGAHTGDRQVYFEEGFEMPVEAQQGVPSE
jgi:hypothetical protein